MEPSLPDALDNVLMIIHFLFRTRLSLLLLLLCLLVHSITPPMTILLKRIQNTLKPHSIMEPSSRPSLMDHASQALSLLSCQPGTGFCSCRLLRQCFRGSLWEHAGNDRPLKCAHRFSWSSPAPSLASPPVKKVRQEEKVRKDLWIPGPWDALMEKSSTTESSS